MKTCKACGTTAEDDAEFCTKCGEYFPAGNAPSQAAPGQSGGAEDLAAVCGRWASKVKEGLEVDDAVYGQILNECLDAVFAAVTMRVKHPRGAPVDLAIMLDDRDLVSDMLKGIVERSEHIGYQREYFNAAREYLYLVLDAFAVYTDLEDLKGVSDDAVQVMDAMSARFPTLQSSGEATDAPSLLAGFCTFFRLLSDKVGRMIEMTTEERREELSDYWADRSGKGFTEVLLNAANFTIQAERSGKLTGKLAVKARDVQLQMFEMTYLNPKQ